MVKSYKFNAMVRQRPKIHAAHLTERAWIKVAWLNIILMQSLFRCFKSVAAEQRWLQLTEGRLLRMKARSFQFLGQQSPSASLFLHL